MAEKNKKKPKPIAVDLNITNISIAVTVVLWLVSTTSFFLKATIIDRLKNDIYQLEEREDKYIDEQNRSKEAIESLNEQNKNLWNKYSSLLNEKDNKPHLLLPKDQSCIISDLVKLSWCYSKHNQNQKYILELLYINDPDPKRIPKRCNVLNPENQMMLIPIKRDKCGQYLWRIKPGELLENREVSQGEWSPYNSFFVYRSVLDKIKDTGRLLVGTSPTFFEGNFSYFEDIDGDIKGFDIELIALIKEKLEIKLGFKKGGKSITVEKRTYPFNQLLDKVRDSEVDFAISSITVTKERQRNGLIFTKKYFETHQLFIQLKDEGTFPNSLEDSTVGVRGGTSNAKAAKALQKKYEKENEIKFKLEEKYQSYADIYKALQENEIQFGLVDYVLVKEKLEDKKFYKFGEYLDKELKGFYEAEYGREADEYAIALKYESEDDKNKPSWRYNCWRYNNKTFEIVLNEILEENNDTISDITKKMGINDTTPN